MPTTKPEAVQLPELVTQGDDGFKRVDYSRLPLVLLEGLREEHARVTALQAENAALKDRLASVEDRLGALEAHARPAPRTASGQLPPGLLWAVPFVIAGAILIVRRRRG